ncbi:hypothetical protein PF002_g25343 [Phytophthora fragariae]|uniref:Uncharacterized protein n=1 Tax=Phytophthora fragariae TaxID=53985 RepID=A0A6A3WNT2_9STRA|nr:hypothetical protein PF002_g25343 [Phytophthora fragariae]
MRAVVGSRALQRVDVVFAGSQKLLSGARSTHKNALHTLYAACERHYTTASPIRVKHTPQQPPFGDVRPRRLAVRVYRAATGSCSVVC